MCSVERKCKNFAQQSYAASRSRSWRLCLFGHMPHDVAFDVNNKATAEVLFFEDIEIGRVLHSVSHIVTPQDIADFARLTYDRTPLHVDEGYARTTLFGRTVAHGLYGLALIEGLKSVSGFFDQTTIASVSWDKVQFRKPIYPGDEVRAVWQFTKTLEQPEKGRGVVIEATRLVNQRGATVTSAVHTFIVRKRGLRDGDHMRAGARMPTAGD